MRIKRLDLTRFGSFTDISLDLSAPGTHVVLGHNEAGKTTAMAAIEQLLYGIPFNTNHAFLHKMPDLRLGALLAEDAGETHEIVRLKKNINALQNAQGQPIEEVELAKLLYGVAEEVFKSLFSISHDEIVAGGAALLDSDGEVGRALFNANSGTTDLTAVLRRLTDRAEQLFKSGGSVPPLNMALKQYKEATAAVKDLSLSATNVLELDQQLATAQEAQEALSGERRSLAIRKALLQQTHNARPFLVARFDALAEQSELQAEGSVVDAEVRSQLDHAKSLHQEGESARRSAEAAISRQNAKLTDLHIDSVLLGQQDKIEKLTIQTGGYEQNEQDTPGLKVAADALERELKQLRKKLPSGAPIDKNAKVVLTVDQQERIGTLAADRATLDSNHHHAAQAAGEAERILADQQAQLAKLEQPADVVAVVSVAARIRKAGDLESNAIKLARELTDLEAALSSNLAALGLSVANNRAIDAVAVPSLEVIRGSGRSAQARSSALGSVEQTIDEGATKLASAESELEQLLRSEQPPTTQDLVGSRARRDQGWQLIRGAWLDGDQDNAASMTWSEGRPLPEVYEAAVLDADEVADRLRREAEAVEKRASLEAQIASLQSEAAASQNSRQALLTEQEAAAAEWAALWQPHGVTPAEPAQMESWRDEFQDCAKQSEQARKLDGKIADLDNTMSRHRADLVASLTAIGATADAALSLQGLLDHADQLAVDATASAQQFNTVTTAVNETQAQAVRHAGALEVCNRALKLWQGDWASAVLVVGLPPTALPAEATAVLAALAAIEAKGKDHEDLVVRISDIKKRSKKFIEGVTAVRGALLVDTELADTELAEADSATAVKMLGRRLSQAKQEETKQRATTEEREIQELAAAEAMQKVAQAQAAISQLVESAGVANEAALVAAIARTESLATLDQKIRSAEDTLRQQAGKSIEQIKTDAGLLEGVEIEPELQQIDTELLQLDESLKHKQITLGELQNQRAQIDSSGAAADQMTQAQQSLAEVVDYAEEYVRTVMAKLLLEEEVARFRDDNQGPLLERARELFRDLTLGRYVGLDTDADDNGSPLLFARMANDRLLDVASLSTGTRDQLYLALRLAALEHFMARRGPLPLLLDDLFVHFDDDRTKAGLVVLDGLADTTQVLLFTHHARVAEQAAEVIATDRVTIHQL